MEGWISLYRKFMNWQWYKDSNVKAVFIHLLLSANHKQEQWNKKTIERGQIITSRENLSKATGLSIQQIRTCLSKLESTNEIKIETTNRYTLIEIINYDKYQKNINEQSTSKLTESTTNKSTSKNDNISTNKKNLESIENKEIQKSNNEISTNKNSSTSTNKSTNISTDQSTTNNNINNTNNIYNNKLNKNKLNELFNYLNRKKKNFDGLTELDRETIVRELKRLEIYAENITHLLTEKTLLQLQLQYWVITQIQLSPYKIYLPNLSRSTFLLKYLYTEKYINIDNDEDKINEFVSYLIVCLRKAFENM